MRDAFPAWTGLCFEARSGVVQPAEVNEAHGLAINEGKLKRRMFRFIRCRNRGTRVLRYAML